MAAEPRAGALEVLRRTFGHAAFRGSQEEIVAHLAAGGDALVLMPTGGGKSLCYQVPSLLRAGTGIVISPLIALMQDQVAALRQLGVRAAFLNSTLDAASAREVERALTAGELDLLYVAPERLLTARCLELLGRSRLALFAIDEAHCVSQWGHDFRPEYLQLSLLHERFPRVPRIALTATADPQTRAEIVSRLELDDARVFVSSFDRPNIRYSIVDKVDPRAQLLAFIREEHPGEAGIVYCLSRRKVEETAAWLAAQGLSRVALPRGYAGRGARRAPGAFPARGCRHHGGDDRLRHGNRQARRALRRPSGPAQEHRGLLPGNRARGSRRPARRRVDGIRAGRRGAAATAHRAVRCERGLQAHFRRQAGRAAGPVRDAGLPARAPARLLRRGERSLRQLRHLSRAAADLGRDRRRAQGAVGDLPHRAALRRRAPDRRAARKARRAHRALGTSTRSGYSASVRSSTKRPGVAYSGSWWRWAWRASTTRPTGR